MEDTINSLDERNREKFVVAKTTEFTKELLKLKADLSGLSINDYVNHLIRGHKIKERLCPSCQNDMSVDYFSDKRSFIANDKEHIVKLNNIPYQKCESCELEVGVEVSKIIEMFILRSLNLNRGKSLLKEIDFKKIL